MHYYYNGVQSWGWYYPFHYAPFLADMVDLEEVDLSFNLGRPFLPFEQLLAVLPAASKIALPPIFWELMESPESPIIDFFPKEFSTDLNGKTQDWEAVVLISFIDENRLRDAMAPLIPKMKLEEAARNVHSPCTKCTFDETLNPFDFPSPLDGFPDLAGCRNEFPKSNFQPKKQICLIIF